MAGGESEEGQMTGSRLKVEAKNQGKVNTQEEMECCGETGEQMPTFRNSKLMSKKGTGKG